MMDFGGVVQFIFFVAVIHQREGHSLQGLFAHKIPGPLLQNLPECHTLNFIAGSVMIPKVNFQ
jgi:hypothetical protein